MSLASRRRMMLKGGAKEEEFPYKTNIQVDTSLVSNNANYPYVLNNIKIKNTYQNITSKYPFFMFARESGNYFLVVTDFTTISSYVTKYEGGRGMEGVGLGSDMRWWFTANIIYESDLADAVSNYPVYKVQRTISGQANTPLEYWKP